MPILYLDGLRFKNAVVVAARRVLDVQERLNSINVFPVPDGDTGTNMALTLRHVAEGAINAGDLELSGMSSVMAESALMGSCGNSGAILAQFFQGMADSFSGVRRVDLEGFANSVGFGVQKAERALADPVEGTILTVMRDWAEHIQTGWENAACFVDLMRDALETAKQSLQETPKKLEVLARAHVVDAGAQGFVNMLEGIIQYADTGEIDWTPSETPATQPQLVLDPENITYRFCTECLIEGTDLDAQRIRAKVGHLGDSLIVAGTGRKVRIHVHTDNPEALFTHAAVFGTLSRCKQEDMRAQHLQGKAEIALITDSSCDLPIDYLIKHQVRVVPVMVTFGTETYLDRVNITSEEVYRMMVEEQREPKTSQPTVGAFAHAMKMAAEHHREAIALTLSSAVSGTYQACRIAARQQNEIRVEVVDSRTTAVALGLLVAVAAEAIAAGRPLDRIREMLEKAREHAHLIVTVETLDYLVRGGRVSRFRGWLARLLRLTPILSFSGFGGIRVVGKSRPGPPSWEKAMAIIKRKSAYLTNLRFQVCQVHAPEAAAYFERELKRHFGLDHVEILAASPSVGAHSGPGTAGIAMLGDPGDPR